MAIARPGVLSLIFFLTACNTPMKQTPAALPLDASVTPAPRPPVAVRVPHQVSSPNGSREDEYYWLRDDMREDPQMLAYVQAEIGRAHV